MTDRQAYKLKGLEKTLVDMGPVAVMFIGYFFSERIAPLLDALFKVQFFVGEGNALFVAVALFLPAFAVAFAYSTYKEKRIAPMLLVTAVIVVILSTLTLMFHNKGFTYIKPTITYVMFGGLLGGGLLAGKNFLKTVFDGTLTMPDEAWRTFTWRFVFFFLSWAAFNEFLWRSQTAGCVEGVECAGERTWFLIETFGFPVTLVIFLLLHAPFLAKYMPDEEADTPQEGEIPQATPSPNSPGDVSSRRTMENSGDNNS